MARKVYKEELEKIFAQGCGVPGCTCVPEWLNAGCHTGSGVDVRYVDGAIEIICHICKEPVITLAIAKLLDDK